MPRSVRIPIANSSAWSQPDSTARVNTPIHEARVPTSVRLDPSIESRLDQLAAATGRSKAFYLRELAASYHSYYDSERILVDDEGVKKARLALVAACAQVLHNGLAMLGVSAPRKM